MLTQTVAMRPTWALALALTAGCGASSSTARDAPGAGDMSGSGVTVDGAAGDVDAGGDGVDGGAGGNDAGGGGTALLGFYAQASCTCSPQNGGPGTIDAFSGWLGSSIVVGSDYTASDSWSNWAFPGWQSPGWTMWRSAHANGRLVLATGMGVAQDMAGGAAGMYDDQWRTLAQSLVAAGYPDAIIRIAHEFNGNWYWYQPQGREAQFIAYWQHAVSAMRSVPGQAFTFFWNPSLGISYENGQYFAPESGYPGDDYVDYIGPDIYDADWGVYPDSGTITDAMRDQVWQNQLHGDHALDWYVQFAAAHHKRLAFGEWGVRAVGSNHGGGDDPAWVTRIHDWIATHDVAFHIYFDSEDSKLYDSASNATDYPATLARYKQLFGM